LVKKGQKRRGVRFFDRLHFANGARRSPDLSWVKREKWDALSGEEKRRFARLVPDFIVELRSESGSLKKCRKKCASISRTASA
jgi:Uma2 family endonuclease